MKLKPEFAQNGMKTAQTHPLTAEEERVIEHKGTEAPFSGALLELDEEGTYHCRKCGATLYTSVHKFDAHCGWPSFDDEVKDAVTRSLDDDGVRVEITCTACGAHLGHVFEGEHLTPKNIRHCVNSVSLTFKPRYAE